MTGRHPLPVALIGAGGIGRAYADLFGRSDVATCVAVSDLSPVAASAFAENVGCEVVPEVENLYNRSDLAAVVICTPPSTHPDLAVAFLDRGIPVLCEKPLAIDPRSARRITEAAARTSTPLSVATKFRFVPEMDEVRRRLDDGSLGDVLLVENAFTAAVDMTQRWNSRPEVSGGGVIADNAPHSFDLIRAVLGPIREVLAVEAERTQTQAVEDTATCHLRAGDGVPAVVDLSWTIDKGLDDYLRIWGTKGAIRLGWRRSIARTAGGDWEEIGPGYQKVPAMQGALDAFARWVLGDGPPALSTDDILGTVATTAAAYTSLSTGTWADVKHGER
jgi:predicted dehydrogenase